MQTCQKALSETNIQMFQFGKWIGPLYVLQHWEVLDNMSDVTLHSRKLKCFSSCCRFSSSSTDSCYHLHIWVEEKLREERGGEGHVFAGSRQIPRRLGAPSLHVMPLKARLRITNWIKRSRATYIALLTRAERVIWPFIGLVFWDVWFGSNDFKISDVFNSFRHVLGRGGGF